MWAKSSKELIQLQQTNPMIKENSSNCKMCTAASRYLGIKERRMLLFAFSQGVCFQWGLGSPHCSHLPRLWPLQLQWAVLVTWLQAVSVPETVSSLVLRRVLNFAFSFRSYVFHAIHQQSPTSAQGSFWKFHASL